MDLRELLDFLIPDDLFGLLSAARVIYRLLLKLAAVLRTPGVREVVLVAGAVGTALMYKRVSKRLQAQATGTPSITKSVGKRVQASATGTPNIHLKVIRHGERPTGEDGA